MIGAIADDLTGAAEIAGLGWSHGLTAQISRSLEPCSRDPLPELLVVDCDSRFCSASDASKRAAAAAASLARLGCSWIYKKIDSVLRGNVLAEIEGALNALRLKRALLVPGNPSAGRIIRHGRYYIHGKPLHETDFVRDPEHPRTSSNVMTLLGASGQAAICLVKSGEKIPESGIVIGEVSSVSDTEYWAQQNLEGVLCAGSGDFFKALLQTQTVTMAGKAEGRQEPPQVQKTLTDHPNVRELFICGSLSDYSLQFVHTSKERGVPIFILPRELPAEISEQNAQRLTRSIGDELSIRSRVILTIGLPIITDKTRANQLRRDLARSAALAIQAGVASHVYVEGGATAASLFEQMDWQTLNVVNQIAQGVVTLKPAASTILVTAKPGSYQGWPTEPSAE